MTRLRAVAPLIVAAALTAVAVLTVARAGCDDPGRYVRGPNGYVLVGGCLAPGDLAVPGPASPTDPTHRPLAPTIQLSDNSDGGVPARS
jgi:hypothetical protein